MGKVTLSALARQNRRGIQSVEIGLGILEAMRSRGGAGTLSELAKATGLTPSNCHRYLVSFLRRGFIEQEAESSRYRFGPRLLQVGLAALSQIDPITIGTDALVRLVDTSGYTGLLAIWADSGVVIIRWMPGRLAVRTTLSAGSNLPLLTSATGRTFLAYLPERQTAQFVEREQKKGDDPARLIASIRSNGLAEASGIYIPGLSAIAAPILDAHGEAAAVLSLVGLAGGLPRAVSSQLKAATKDASIRLGWPAESAL